MDRWVKRSVDVLLALLGLIVGAPLIALIALAIRLDSPGRVIFSQARLGQHGRVFRIHKFRKFPDAWGDRGAAVTVANDARMTRLGRLLERTKFDEIPQLWNILKGEMSFVGPRPHTLRSRDLYTGEFARVLDFVPGIFGPNQVAFRNESQMYPPDQDPETFYREELFPRKARADIAYFSRSNTLTDLTWIVRGFWFSIVGAVDWRAQARLRGSAVVVDFLAIQMAWLGANLARFEGWPSGVHAEAYLTGVWLMPLVVLPVMAVSGCYRGTVRHFSAGDALRLAVGSLTAWILAFLVLMAFLHRELALGLVPLAYLLAVALMGGARMLYRERFRRAQNGPGAQGTVRLAVYGAGHRGVALASLLDQGFPRVEVVGFFDDNDAEMRGRFVNGRPVLGSERDLDTVHSVVAIEQLWTTFEPDMPKYQRLKRWCAARGIRLVVLPVVEPFLGLLEPHSPVPGRRVHAASDSTAAWPKGV